MNLLQETKNILKTHGKTIDDIKWVGCEAFTIPITLFLKLADKEYNSSYGSAKVAQDLLVVGDGWWLDRGEYDGSEWWDYNECMIKPKQEIDVKHVVGDEFMWETLAEMNKIKEVL